MNLKTYLFTIWLAILIILSTNSQSTANNIQATSSGYNYNGKITFLDGTPILRGMDTDDFSLDLDRAPDLYAAYIKSIKDGNINFICSVKGKYTLKFMGIEIVRFEVTEQDQGLNSNLPDNLRVPFNFIATSKPNSIVKVYDDKVNLVESLQTNEDGVAALKGDKNYFSNKFLITEAEDQIPYPAFFKEIKASNNGNFSYRKINLSTQKIIAKRGFVHNIKTNTYYTSREISFNKNKKIWLLIIYEGKTKKIKLSKLDFSAYAGWNPSQLFLDEKGSVVVNMAKRLGGSNDFEYQALEVSKNGSLSKNDNTFVFPAYRFNNNFVKGGKWIIPTFVNIALTEGGHEFKITCNGKWSERIPDRAREKLNEEIAILEEEILKALNEGIDIGNSKSIQLTEKREQLNEMPPSQSFKEQSGSLSSSESFNVFLSPFSDQLWKMTSSLDTANGNKDEIRYDKRCVKQNPAVKSWQSQLNKIRQNNALDSQGKQQAREALGPAPAPSCLQWDSTAKYYYTRYKPRGWDPKSDLAKKNMGITECIIEVDGTPFNYSYPDPDAGKGIMYMDWDNEQDRKSALESALKNATIYMGFAGEMESGYDGWGKNIDLFDNTWDLISNQPINSWEGPYPELRYGFRELLGEYPNIKEARKHCQSPRRNNKTKKYECFEEKVVSVCLDNYQYKLVNGRVETNYEALYCGEMEPEENNLKGDEIVVVVTADGYIEETRALAKRSLEASNILLSGHITDKEGVEIEGASVKLRGFDGSAVTDDAGIYNLTAKAQGNESHSEVMDIKLQKIGIEISHEELGDYEEDKPYGLVSDGFTTLKLKVEAKGIRPNTVSVKQPALGSFVEQTMLKVPLVLDANGEGELEYVPPAYLTNEDLSKKLEVPGLGQLSLPFLWVAEVPIQFTYEDEEGNPGTFQVNIFITRPPVFPIHGFTGDLSTWAHLAGFLREQKYNFVLREYYEGPADESTIQRQSQKLGQYIQNTQKAYKENGILQNRIDIVAHSMGGLISRHYISNMAKYGEKAGIVIPYNVKLSREELEAQRFTSPVKLNDIRKLIMVGTPNHGATWIDGRIGYLGAYLGDVHEVANSQLRSNSQFLANLNAGESQGRHLAPNVQYALLYGRRRLKSLYPPDYLKYQYTDPEALVRAYVTEDDGVVKVSSAKLNGVIDFAFPEKRDNPYGFIHSPSLSFPFSGDKSITTDIEIFTKVNELLLEDIPRMPLKNSFAKVYGSEGDVSMRYYSTESWRPMETGTSKKLENYWCQFNTGEGRTRVAFFLNNYHWGSIHIEPNTILRIENASPELVEVYLQQGRARFTSRRQEGGGFEIAMGDETEKWYTFNPKALVVDINTDFIIEKDESIKVHAVHGEVSIGISDETPENLRGKKIESNGGIVLTATNEMIDSPLPDSGWWSAIDTTYLPDEAPELLKDMLIEEDFSGNLSNWDTSAMKPILYEGNLFWEVGESNKLIHKTPIPLQNIIIEFDGWVEKNGLSVEWYNSDIKGFNFGIGAYNNTKSAIGLKDKDTYEFSWFPGTHLKLNTWHHYKFVVGNNKLKVYLDDQLIGSKELYQNLPGEGKLAFNSYQSRIAIDNVQVYKGNAKELSEKEIAKQNLIVNGSFEEGPSFGAYLTMRAGTTIPGWKVTKETVDLTGSYFMASDGERSIDLVGTPGLGAIKQTLKTKAGERYQLSFKLAGNPAGGPNVKKMKVTAGSQSNEFEFDISGKNTQQMGWVEKSWIFVAEDDETTVNFEALLGENASNYGAAIDEISVIPFSDDFTFAEIDSAQEVVQIQNLGEVEVFAKDEYLPISGFTHLEVNAKNDLGSALESPYEVNIVLEKPELLPFIEITNPKGFIDNTGNYKYDITISEPNIEDFNSLNEIPMGATFVVQVIHPQTKAIAFEQKTTLPLGMTLIQGQTIGPDYKPRQEPLPPEFYSTNYQIANQADEEGNFYILFNTTLYEKDIEKFKQLAERTQQMFSMDQFEFSIQWSPTCSLPFKYVLTDSIKSQLTVANKVKIGRNGQIDLLSPEEHEQRIKQKVTQFIERMPLKPEKKSFVLSKLDRLTFRYSGTTEIPVFTDNLTFSNVIEAPSTREVYWSSTNLNGRENPSFTLMMHVMGHFLHHAIVLPENRFYNFLAKKCNGNEKIWNHQLDLLKYMFDKSEYISFSEAGADFFNYLMFKFIEQSDQDFVNKSIYYNPAYLAEFANSKKAMQTKQKYPSYAVSGSQTAFLVDYYGNNCQNNPARVYSDFLLNQVLYAVYSKGGDPASTINEWLVTKRQSFNKEYLDGDSNPFAKAMVYGLVKEDQNISLMPTGEHSSSSANINRNLVSDFSQIPSVTIAPNTTLSIENGNFNLIAISKNSVMVIELEPKAKIRIEADHSIKLTEGNFRFKSPLNFKTPLARFNSKSSNFSIKLEEDETSIIVFEGEVKLTSDADEDTVRAGQSTRINKRGKIRRPRDMKEIPVQPESKIIEVPFRVYR